MPSFPLKTSRFFRFATPAIMASSLLIAIPYQTTASAASPAAITCSPSTGGAKTPGVFLQPTKNLLAKNYTMRIVTNCGNIVAVVDAKSAPITVRNIAFLATSKYFDNTLCHRLTTAGIDVLQCGDPTASGGGGPGFTYADENLPVKQAVNRYPEGTVAMANAGAGTNGSQFFLVYGNGSFDLPANYTIWGRITKGLNILKAIAAKGVVGGGTDGAPIQAVTILSLRIK
jgi:peptidyl-prolyl cis-trans isomerase B (cyclophilin B)